MTNQKIHALVNSICIVLLTMSLSFIIIIYFKDKNKEIKYDRHVVQDLELELKYWEIKAELVDSIQSYINKTAPNSDLSGLVLLNECTKYNVDVIFTLVQGQKESHFGTKGIGGKINSVWNVKVYDGLKAEEISKSGVHDHPNESIEPYLKLLTSKYLINKTEEDLLNKFVNTEGNRYASYPKYEEELTILYNKLNDTKLRELYDRYKYYSLKLNY